MPEQLADGLMPQTPQNDDGDDGEGRLLLATVPTARLAAAVLPAISMATMLLKLIHWLPLSGLHYVYLHSGLLVARVRARAGKMQKRHARAASSHKPASQSIGAAHALAALFTFRLSCLRIPCTAALSCCSKIRPAVRCWTASRSAQLAQLSLDGQSRTSAGQLREPVPLAGQQPLRTCLLLGKPVHGQQVTRPSA